MDQLPIERMRLINKQTNKQTNKQRQNYKMFYSLFEKLAFQPLQGVG